MAPAASAKHFAARHPRYTTLLAAILVGLLFVYAQGQPDERYSTRDPLRRWIQEEDRRYQQTLRERDAMIRKWGPTPDRVEACVPSSHTRATRSDPPPAQVPTPGRLLHAL